jgi:hypothetical protein
LSDVVQQLRAEDLQRGVGELGLGDDRAGAEDPEARRPADGVFQEGGLAQSLAPAEDEDGSVPAACLLDLLLQACALRRPPDQRRSIHRHVPVVLSIAPGTE